MIGRSSDAAKRPEFILIDANGNEIVRKPALASKWGWYADIGSPNVKAVALAEPVREELRRGK